MRCPSAPTDASSNPIRQAQRELQHLTSLRGSFPTAKKLLLAEIKRLLDEAKNPSEKEKVELPPAALADEKSGASTDIPTQPSSVASSAVTDVNVADEEMVMPSCNHDEQDSETTESTDNMPEEEKEESGSDEAQSESIQDAAAPSADNNNNDTNSAAEDGGSGDAADEKAAGEEEAAAPNTNTEPAEDNNPPPVTEPSSAATVINADAPTVKQLSGSKGILKIRIPIEDYPGYNFIGRLLGPRGATLKQLQSETGCRMFIRGRGSLRCNDPQMEHHKSFQAGYEHLREDLHMLIEHDGAESEREEAMGKAEQLVRQLLVPPESDEQVRPPLSSPLSSFLLFFLLRSCCALLYCKTLESQACIYVSMHHHVFPGADACCGATRTS